MPDISKRRILIVDDEEDFVLSLQDILEQREYRVQGAHSIAEAMAEINRFDAQIALLDIRLGKDNGVELIAQLKRVRPQIRCIMMTAYAALESAVNALQEGAFDYLRKPLDIQDLLATLERSFETIKLYEEKAAVEATLKERNRTLEKLNRQLENEVEERRKIEASLRQNELQIKKLNNTLDRRNRELRSILYSASHDFKSPLFTIAGFATLLDETHAEKLPLEAKDFIRRICRASEHLQTLITDLQLITKAEEEIIEPRRISFKEVAQGVFEKVSSRFREQSVALKMADDFPLVYGDPQRLSKVVENLFINALDFMGENSTPQVELGWRREPDGTTVFWVRDNGIGIDKQYHEKIFDPFYQIGDLTFNRTGIGLALVKLIVEQHDGRVWVESSPGSGSIFYFTLPA